jgi:hypothetical protein
MSNILLHPRAMRARTLYSYAASLPQTGIAVKGR